MNHPPLRIREAAAAAAAAAATAAAGGAAAEVGIKKNTVSKSFSVVRLAINLRPDLKIMTVIEAMTEIVIMVI